MKETLKQAFLKSLPVMAGYVVLGFGFGIIAQKSGYGIVWVFAMSVFIYAGSMQYVAVDLLTGGATLLAAALTTLMVNARHLFYGISMIEHYKDADKKKTYSLVCSGRAPAGLDFHRYCFWVSLFNQCYWILGSLLGGLAGTMITFNTAGVDFAMTALFITVFVEQWKSTGNHLPAIIGVIASVICLLIFGRESFLIPAMLLIGIALTVGRKAIERKGDL